MSNRFLELERKIGKKHPTKAPGAVKSPARAAAPRADPAPAPAVTDAPASAAWYRQPRAAGIRSKGRARAQGAVNYAVPGPFDAIAQRGPMDCWAVVYTMMRAWLDQQSMTPPTALALAGQRWVTLYRQSLVNPNTGLSSSAKVQFLADAGLVAEPPQSYAVEGWDQMLRHYGPLWVTTDEAAGPGWAIHARIMTGIHGDGTPSGTRVDLIDPNGGRVYTEALDVFTRKFEEEAIAIVASRSNQPFRIQVVHWPAGARRSHGQGMALAYRAASVRRASWNRRPTALSASELTLHQKVPNISERDAVGASTTVITRESEAFKSLVKNTNPDIIFKDEEGTEADRMMSPKLADRINALATLVKNEWPGTKLRVTEAWDEDMEHSDGSTHYEARAADLTTNPKDSAKLGRLGRLAVDAGFDWVFYEDSQHVHASVSLAGVAAAPTPTAPTAQSWSRFHRQNGHVVPMSQDIPLDPGTGGQSIGTSALEIGDIIVTTGNQPISGMIRAVSGSPVSHAIIYVGDGMVVEAIGEGVVLRLLEESLATATLAVAFRSPGLTDQQRLMIRDFAGQQVGRRYAYTGIVRQALFRLDLATWCRNKTGEELERCRVWVGRVNLGTERNDEFFCSQLVLAAYAHAGVPLTTTPPHWTSPGEVADLAWTGTLGYVGHLKTP